MDGLPRHEREGVCRRLRSTHSTCRNSVIEHLKDKNIEKLSCRIKALTELKQLMELTGGRLDNSGKVHTELSSMITFARLAMKQVHIH